MAHDGTAAVHHSPGDSGEPDIQRSKCLDLRWGGMAARRAADAPRVGRANRWDANRRRCRQRVHRVPAVATGTVGGQPFGRGEWVSADLHGGGDCPVTFGPNEPQVLWVRDALERFSLDEWSALEAASEGPFAPQREKVYDAVA